MVHSHLLLCPLTLHRAHVLTGFGGGLYMRSGNVCATTIACLIKSENSNYDYEREQRQLCEVKNY